jgi:hypothetical protein
MGAWEDFRYELRELIDCGDDRDFSVYTVREGKIVKQQMFRRRAEALEAAGLSE